MENTKVTKENFIKIKDIVIFILLLLWMIIPVLQSFDETYNILLIKKYNLSLMKATGVAGIALGIYFASEKIKQAEDKKEVIKELLPIFIFTLYMIWTLISCILSPNRELAFNGTSYRKEGYIMYLIYAGYFFCAYLLESKKLRKILLNIFVIVSIFLIIISRAYFTVLKYTDIFLYNTPDKSVFAQFNHYGYYLMMSLMCALGLFITEKNKILKVVYLVAYTVIGYALIFNNTFGCYLATAIVLIAYCIYALVKKRDRAVALIATAIFIILSFTVTKNDKNLAYENMSGLVSDIKTIITKVFNIEEDSPELEESFEKAGTSRMSLWKNGIKFMMERPIIGYGPENLKEKYKSVSINQDRPHNLLIQLATTSGIPGMILYVTAVGLIVVRGIKNLIKNNGSGKIFLIIVITYLTSAMFGNSMYYTSPYYFIFLGFLINCNSYKQKEE